ncbi:MAG: hypothetical protein ACOX4M_07255 [Acetivibrionales bacterium]
MITGRFYPSVIVAESGISQWNCLKSMISRGLILDIDNTLAPNHAAEADDKTVKWIERPVVGRV